MKEVPEEIDDAAEVSRIEQLYVDYRGAVEAGNIEGYIAALHPQVRLIPPGAEPVDGAANYAGFLVHVFETADYRIDVEFGPVIDVLGDVATAEYVYTVHLALKNPEIGVNQEGALSAERTRSRYLDVLRKKDDGAWAIWRHTWNVLEE